MKTKKYYTLKELSSEIDIDDIFYSVQQRELTFSFFLPERQYVAIDLGAPINIGKCLLNYEGLVKLSIDDSIELIHAKSLKTDIVLLSERAYCTVEETEYPYRGKVPNSVFKAWKQTKYLDLPEENIPAMFKPKESILKNPLSHLVQEGEVWSTLSQITAQPHIFVLENVVVQHENLVEAGLFPSKQKQDIPNSLLLEGKRISPLHEVLAQILIVNQSISAKACELLLRQEVQLTPDEREFDSLGILIDMSDSELMWKNTRGGRGTFKLSSLGATLSSIRKRLKAQDA